MCYVRTFVEKEVLNVVDVWLKMVKSEMQVSYSQSNAEEFWNVSRGASSYTFIS